MIYNDLFQGSEQSFWEEFPQMKTGLFKKMYSQDRSKAKNKSSKAMWWLALAKDLDSDFYSMDEPDRVESLDDLLEINIKEYFASEEDYLMHLNAFEDHIDTPLSADVRALENKLLERRKFIIETKYTVDEMVYPDKDKGETFKPFLSKGTAVQLDKMMTDSKKVHDEIRLLRSALKIEQESMGKGGRARSYLDS